LISFLKNTSNFLKLLCHNVFVNLGDLSIFEFLMSFVVIPKSCVSTRKLHAITMFAKNHANDIYFKMPFTLGNKEENHWYCIQSDFKEKLIYTYIYIHLASWSVNFISTLHSTFDSVSKDN
jgi:hypothetical protein